MITDILIACTGWVVGAIVNYLADVLPLRRRLVRPFCIACDQSQDLVSYAIWPRRCRNCGVMRSWRIWLVEIIYILLSIWLWRTPGAEFGYWAGLLVFAFFGVVVIIDLEYRLILHPVSIAGAIIAFVFGLYFHDLPTTILGGVVGFGSMWLVYQFGILLIRFINKRKQGQYVEEVAFGFGDVNLGGVIGLLLGWPSILVGLFLTVFLAGVVNLIYLIIMLLLRKYKLFSALPYGPNMVAAALLIIYFRDEIIALLTR